MLLRDLTIENYRSFDKYRLDNLARVNLLVGDNNCGKTSVLEAVHVLVANGKISCAMECLRGSLSGRRLSINGKEEEVPDVMSWVRRTRDEPHPNTFSISERASDKTVRLDILLEDAIPVEVRSSAASRTHPYRYELVRLDGKRIARTQVPSDRPPFDAEAAKALRTIPKHIFISGEGLGASYLVKHWDELLRTKAEGLVIDAMSLIDDQIVDINVTSQVRGRSSILFDRGSERVSASEVGFGTFFLFSISVALASSKAGVVLVDEIDTGIHYSRLADMWKMVIQSAKDLDVQVFATTHSLDCIRGLAEAVERDSTFTDDVAVFRIDRREDEAVRFGGDELRVVVDHEIEVR